MNHTEPPSEPLPLTPPIWVALMIAALTGFAYPLTHRDGIRTLGYLNQDNPVILRSVGTAHVFPSIGVRVTPPEGWSYLSMTDDVLDTRPTFVNESLHAIVRIHPALIEDWPSEIAVKHQFGDARCEWIDLTRKPLMVSFDAFGTRLTHRWDEHDQRKVGRVAKGDSEVTLVAVLHPRDQSVESLESFCASIEFTDE